ncbi:DUF1772 domain-containing protein [Peribacillus loiseleuriae]|uniref:DUF1772 domain-containing protein n=1 Tax=Peribacillus loiseleuriae TaxID=1679170 RepID=A0A0K9GTQ0_9BACI|nr:DUF1772 domain-containing protein [Peribacillus loiseleuriae]KMY50006.1 hypothetical protein AC625_11195 [Peribacillus loiseleuriae]
MFQITIEIVCLFLAGILAGEEFVVRYGVHVSMSILDEQSHIKARQALILRLRVLVPAIILPTIVSGVALLTFGGSTRSVFVFQCAGVLALLFLMAFTLVGTVPINKGALDWQPDSPPSNWKVLVKRWGRLDIIRSSAAILAFLFFLIAVALQLAGN